MKKIYLIPALFALTAVMAACGGKSKANKEQIENAREEAGEMTSGFDAAKSMKPSQTTAQVIMDTEEVTEIVVSEEPAPSDK